MKVKTKDADSFLFEGWHVYRAKLPHNVYFLVKKKVRLRTESRELMLEIIKGGDYGNADAY